MGKANRLAPHDLSFVMTNLHRRQPNPLAVMFVVTLTACTANPGELEAEAQTDGSESSSSSGDPVVGDDEGSDGSESDGGTLDGSDGSDGSGDSSGDSSGDGSEDDSGDGSDDGSGGNPPTCEDGEHNGDEEGVDCGGACPPCLPPPADAVDNPSFEETPDGAFDIPGWTVLEDIGGMAYAEISGPAQTTAPDGARALRLESTNNDIVGARTVRSSPFLPPAGTCTVTVAVGDSNEDSEFTDFGQLRVRAPSLPSPLDLVAEIDIDNRMMGGVSPPTDGYVDAELTFAADGETLHHVEIRVRGSYGTLSYHADDVRIECEP